MPDVCVGADRHGDNDAHMQPTVGRDKSSTTLLIASADTEAMETLASHIFYISKSLQLQVMILHGMKHKVTDRHQTERR